jgi:hypothetical protein
MHSFLVKGQFKDEFVTAGGVPLSEVRSLSLSLSLSLTHTHTHTHCKYNCFSCLSEDLAEYNGKQNTFASILCRGGNVLWYFLAFHSLTVTDTAIKKDPIKYHFWHLQVELSAGTEC